MLLQISSFGYIHTFISTSFVILVWDAASGSEATFVAMLGSVFSARELLLEQEMTFPMLLELWTICLLQVPIA